MEINYFTLPKDFQLGTNNKSFATVFFFFFFFYWCPTRNNRKATGFHMHAQLFDLNFFARKAFLYMVKPGNQNHLESQLLCMVLLVPTNNEDIFSMPQILVATLVRFYNRK